MSTPPHAGTATRIACAIVPEFALAVSRRLDAPAPGQPLALVEERGQGGVVRAVDAAAREAGVRLGQSAARARARCPALCCRPWRPERLAEAARALAGMLHEAAPLVVPADDEAPGAFWIDAQGLGRLGGEPALARRLVKVAKREGYPTLRIGVADSAVAARAAALAAGPPVRLVPPGGDAAFLGGLSLEALQLPEDIAESFALLGLRSVADLHALPEGPLLDRFGPAARALLDRALGHDARRPTGRPPEAPPEVGLTLDQPVDQTEALLFGLRGLLDRLAARLLARGLAASRLALRLALDDRSDVERVVEPARPLQHPGLLFELLRDRLERFSLEAPVVELRVVVLEAVPALAEQAHLGVAGRDTAALEAALHRLRGRFGDGTVVRPRPADDPRPEASGRWEPVADVPLAPYGAFVEPHPGSSFGTKPREGPALEGGTPRVEPRAVFRLLPACRPLEARFDAAGLPRAVRWGEAWRPVRVRGPERLSGGWWTGSGYAREDYRLLLPEGAVLWASRDARKGEWQLLGWMD